MDLYCIARSLSVGDRWSKKFLPSAISHAQCNNLSINLAESLPVYFRLRKGVNSYSILL